MDAYPEIAERFGHNLLRARSRADISQEELAFRADVHRTEVSQLERGLRVPRIDTVLKLAAALEASLDELIEGIGWRAPRRQGGGFELAEVTQPQGPKRGEGE